MHEEETPFPSDMDTN